MVYYLWYLPIYLGETRGEEKLANSKKVTPLSQPLQDMRDYLVQEIEKHKNERPTVLAKKGIHRKDLAPLLAKENARFPFEEAPADEAKLLSELRRQLRQLDERQALIDKDVSGLETLLKRFDKRLYKNVIKVYLPMVINDVDVQLSVGERKFLLRDSLIAMRDELLAMGMKIYSYDW